MPTVRPDEGGVILTLEALDGGLLPATPTLLLYGGGYVYPLLAFGHVVARLGWGSPLDAFYLPLARFEGVMHPGSRIDILTLRPPRRATETRRPSRRARYPCPRLRPCSRASLSSSAFTTKSITVVSAFTQWSRSSRCRAFGMRVAS